MLVFSHAPSDGLGQIENLYQPFYGAIITRSRPFHRVELSAKPQRGIDTRAVALLVLYARERSALWPNLQRRFSMELPLKTIRANTVAHLMTKWRTDGPMPLLTLTNTPAPGTDDRHLRGAGIISRNCARYIQCHHISPPAPPDD